LKYQEQKLYEISAVTDPAYKETSIAQRSADREALEKALESLESEKAILKALEDKKRALALKIKLNL
jgi:phage head maturation protease